MKVMYHGKEIELDSTMEKGKIELDKKTEEEEELAKIDFEDTVEISEKLLEKIMQGEKNEE